MKAGTAAEKTRFQRINFVRRYGSDFALAAGNLLSQKTRTLLTALGIIFGVGAVIGMLAIGAGARDESLRFIEQLGVRNLLIESIPATSSAEKQQRLKSSQGLNERDVRIIQANLDSMNLLSARRTLHPSRLLPKPVGEAPWLYGVESPYAQIHNWTFAEGSAFGEAEEQASARSACSAKLPRPACWAMSRRWAGTSRSRIRGCAWWASCEARQLPERRIWQPEEAM